MRLPERRAAISSAASFTGWPAIGACALPSMACALAARFTFTAGSGLARTFFATCSAFASTLELCLVAGFFIDRDDAVRAACFVPGALAGRVVFAERLAGLPVTLFALRAAVATCFPAGLAQPETVTFLAPLALAFAEILLTGRKSTFAMVGQRV